MKSPIDPNEGASTDHPGAVQTAARCDASQPADQAPPVLLVSEVSRFGLEQLPAPWKATEITLNGETVRAMVGPNSGSEGKQGAGFRFAWDQGLYRVELTTTLDEQAARTVIADLKIVDAGDLIAQLREAQLVSNGNS